MCNFRVCIVGGGLAGSLLANGLINNGVDTMVFERDEETLKREGYQIRLGDPALTGLASCLTDSQLESIVQKLGRYSGSSKTAPSICNTKFQTILDLSALPTYSKSSAINRVVLRDLLLDPVIAEGRVKFGKHFSHYEIIENGPSGNESVKVNFTDGSSEYCDILVAADGSGSKVSESCLIPISFHPSITDTELSMQINKQIGAKNLVDMKSHVSFLSKGNATKERLRQLPPRLLNGPILVFKNGISLYYARRIPLTLILYHFPIDIVQFTCPPPNRKTGIKIKMTISTLTRTKHHSTGACLFLASCAPSITQVIFPIEDRFVLI
jgi:hypothetical protein